MKKAKTLQARILSGSVILLSGSSLATAINFAYNIAVARFLGPKAFGHATAVYTLLTLISAVTLSFQIVSAKIVAQQTTLEGKSAAYRDFHRGAWACGLFVALLLFVFQRGIADYLRLPSPVLVALIAIGAAFYVPLGSRRGYIQGAHGFRLFATSLVLEGAVRLCGSILLILLGMGVEGVIAANAAAVAVAYFAATPKLAGAGSHQLRLSYALREVLQGMVFFAGQVLINNSDIVLVKHFFVPTEAGLYAAVAMVGRVIFTFSSAVVNSMFPLVAGTRHEERKDLKVIATALLLVLSIGSTFALCLRIAPAWIWTDFFGAKFAIAGKYGFPYLLALYAITTVIYSLSVVIITYEMSYKIANTSWIQLAFSGVLIAGICLFHSSLREVILVQLVLMFGLLALVSMLFLIDLLAGSRNLIQDKGVQPIRVIRRVSEDEVIAEFLKSDFKTSVFSDYHQALRGIVTNPNFDDASENAKRRALLFIRHLALWKELPDGTEWYEVEVKEAGLDQIRVFPRAQWRNFAHGNFSITEVSERMRKRQDAAEDPFLSKVSSIREALLEPDADWGAVLLIGVSESEPVTILDGNHRFAAAVLASPTRLHRLRFLCGLSPKMAECCWYNTNFMTLCRYGRNLLSQVVRDPKGELARLLQNPG
jgi:O-antigen/teichoic acid export membrane protein